MSTCMFQNIVMFEKIKENTCGLVRSNVLKFNSLEYSGETKTLKYLALHLTWAVDYCLHFCCREISTFF